MRLTEKQKRFLKEKKYIKLNPQQKEKVILEFKRTLESDGNIFDEIGMKIKKAGTKSRGEKTTYSPVQGS